MHARHCPTAVLPKPATQANQPKHSAKAGLPFTLKPVPPQDTAAALLPRLALASAPVARVVSLYRQLLAETLGMVSGALGWGRQGQYKGNALVVTQVATHGMSKMHCNCKLMTSLKPAPFTVRPCPQGAASLAPASDPVLAAFPGVLDDEDLSDAFLQ